MEAHVKHRVVKLPVGSSDIVSDADLDLYRSKHKVFA